MRAILVVLLTSLLLLGCKHSRPSDRAQTDPAATGTEPGKEPQVQQATPLTESTGKVASVRQDLRFVVIDFAFNPVPPVDQRMGVYRNGQKIGELKISRGARNNIVPADITAGDAAIGDEVRPE